MSELAMNTHAPRMGNYGPAEGFGSVLRRVYSCYPDRPALMDRAAPVSYIELGQRVRALGHGLVGLGLEPGDRVLLVMENRPEFVELEQTLFTHGLVRVALSYRLHIDEIRRIAVDCAARAIVTTGERAAALAEAGGTAQWRLISVDGTSAAGVVTYADLAILGTPGWACGPPVGADVAALLYTSGTTGDPKGATLTHRNWAAMVRNLLGELPVVVPGDTVLHVAPVSHFSGSVGAAYTVKGAAFTTMSHFDPPAVLRAINERRASVVPLVPTMLKRLVTAAEQGDYDLSELRAIPYGGSAISAQWLARAHDVFGDVLVQMYGLSEVLIPISALAPTEHRYTAGEPLPERLSTAGHPSPFVEVRIADTAGRDPEPGVPGEVLVRGENVMDGYWDDAHATEEMIDSDGWAHTGDVGVITPEGCLKILDRSSDVIVSGGFNVYPAEVERVIEPMTGVREVAVVGVPDPDWGEAVKAVIVPLGDRPPTPEQVGECCRSQLAGYKIPRSVDYAETLPKTASGKVARRAIRDKYWATQERNVGE